MAGNRRNGKKLRGCAIFCAGGRDLEGGKSEPTTAFQMHRLRNPSWTNKSSEFPYEALACSIAYDIRIVLVYSPSWHFEIFYTPCSD